MGNEARQKKNKKNTDVHFYFYINTLSIPTDLFIFSASRDNFGKNNN